MISSTTSTAYTRPEWPPGRLARKPGQLAADPAEPADPAESGPAGDRPGPSARPGNAPTIYGVFSKVDTNADGVISGQENEAYLRRVENQKQQMMGAPRTLVEGASSASPGSHGSAISAAGSFSAFA